MQFAVNPNKQLSESERRAMLAVWAGHAPHETITAALYFLDMHMPRKFLLPALMYLQRQRLVGKKLADFIEGDCQRRYLVFQQKLTAAVLKEPGVILVAGETFK